ncbi:WbuC family cupin fold metalloprotein [Microcoleus anatoxicus]|uniref:WbuC family cupin fold metalloprotein n=1 Tax=Microcoleus anatoxicus TaxID=2705319 RepID=UPI0030C97478
MSAVLFVAQEEIIEVGHQQIAQLKQAAIEAPLKRSRICLHQDHSDQVQEMVIAFCKDSYIRPHRHLKKSESFHVIEGSLIVVFFDDNGEITRRVEMSSQGSRQTFIYRLSSSLWHTVVPRSEFVILHETTTGPFIKGDTEFPSWAPEDGDTQGIWALLARIAP